MPGKTRLRNDLLCVEWDVKPYTLTYSFLIVPNVREPSSVGGAGAKRLVDGSLCDLKMYLYIRVDWGFYKSELSEVSE